MGEAGRADERGTGEGGGGGIERLDPGEVPYEEAVERMTCWVGRHNAGEIPDRLALLTRPPVITYGSRTLPGVTMTSPAEPAAPQGRSASPPTPHLHWGVGATARRYASRYPRSRGARTAGSRINVSLKASWCGVSRYKGRGGSG